MKSGKDFKAKHQAGEKADPALEKALKEKAEQGRLACAQAFAIAARFGVPPSAVGLAADFAGVRLSKCQLGLFGHAPENRIVKPAADVTDELKAAIQAALVENKLPCAKAWEIAKSFKLAKMDVSAACEAMGLKIKPCQLGAF